MSDKKYEYKRFGCDAKRVGQAAIDILSKNQPDQTVEETLDEYGKDYVKHFETAVKDGSKRYVNPFHVLVLSNKEMWAPNVMRNWFIPRQTAPRAHEMIYDYPNHMKTLYKIDVVSGKAELLWTLPGKQDCQSIMKTPQSYSPDLVKWIMDAFSGLI